MGPVCYSEAEPRPFLLEYDRGTLDAGDYRAKFAGYRRYFAAREWQRHFDSEPVLLFVCVDGRAERRVTHAAHESRLDLPLSTTVEWRLATAATPALSPGCGSCVRRAPTTADSPGRRGLMRPRMDDGESRPSRNRPRVERRFEPNRTAMLAALRIVLRLPARIEEGGGKDGD